jgi:Transcriptional regulators
MHAASHLALQPLNATVSIVDQAYTALKQAIMAADIYGQREEIRLDERQLSRALGVSRTPIREAMALSSRRASCAPFRGAASSSSERPRKRSSRSSRSARRSRAWRRGLRRSRRPMKASARCATCSTSFTAPRRRAPARVLGREHRLSSGDHQPLRLASHVEDDREPLRPRAGDSPHDDLAEGPRVTFDCRSHAIIEALERRDTELAERLVRQHSLDLAAHVEKCCDFLD